MRKETGDHYYYYHYYYYYYYYYKGSISKITKLPKQTDDPQKRRPDITLAKRVLNWYPVVSLEDGIRETTAFFKNELSKTNIHK